MLHQAKERLLPELPGCLVGFRSVRHFLSPVLQKYVEQAYSVLYRGDAYLVKICKPQSMPKDVFRKYVGNSQAAREMKGARKLAFLGIRTPTPLGSAFSLNPLAAVESIYVMEFIDSIPRERLSPDAARACYTQVANDLLKMKSAGILFKDLHFRNILFRENGEVVWIDSDVKIIRDNDKFSRLFDKSLKRFLAGNEGWVAEHILAVLAGHARKPEANA